MVSVTIKKTQEMLAPISIPQEIKDAWPKSFFYNPFNPNLSDFFCFVITDEKYKQHFGALETILENIPQDQICGEFVKPNSKQRVNSLLIRTLMLSSDPKLIELVMRYSPDEAFNVEYKAPGKLSLTIEDGKIVTKPDRTHPPFKTLALDWDNNTIKATPNPDPSTPRKLTLTWEKGTVSFTGSAKLPPRTQRLIINWDTEGNVVAEKNNTQACAFCPAIDKQLPIKLLRKIIYRSWRSYYRENPLSYAKTYFDLSISSDKLIENGVYTRNQIRRLHAHFRLRKYWLKIYKRLTNMHLREPLNDGREEIQQFWENQLAEHSPQQRQEVQDSPAPSRRNSTEV